MVSTAPVATDVAVRVTGFEKAFRRRAAVRGVDLEVRRGEIFGLIGPDGAGKSTLMKAIAGILTYDGGRVEVFGTVVDSEQAAERIKGRLGFMPQGLGLNLYPDLSIEENVDFFAGVRLVPAKALAARKERLLGMTRLDRFRTRPMRNLSGGMKQKLGLVCALIHEPELVILDEPTTGVDPVSRRDFWAILADLLVAHGMTALVSTSYMDEASRFQRSAMLCQGRVIAQGTADEMLDGAPASVVEVAVAPVATALERLLALGVDVTARGTALRAVLPGVSADAASQRVRGALEGLEVGMLHVGPADLEDVFVHLATRQGLGDVATRPLATSAVAARSAPDGELAIEAHALVRDFGAFRAVDHVTFQVKAGEIFGLLGANGAGKTTTIKMLTGLLPPTGGSGRVAGADMRHAGADIKERIGYMSQAFSLYQDLTVVENIRLYAGIYGLDAAETRRRLDWIVDIAGLAGQESALTGRLPMGVRQRLALGCALVHRPRILFLDEPTSGVDPVGRRRFWEILFQLSRENGVAILVTTHYMSEAEPCDRLALMYSGRIVADASPAEMKRAVMADAGQLLEITADRPLAALALLERSGFEGVGLFGNAVHLLARDRAAAEARIHAALGAGDVRALTICERPLSMEDVFVYRVLALERQERPAA